MIRKEPLPDGRNVTVTFELPSSIWAEQVSLVGDFNDWDPARHELRQGGRDGNWHISLILPARHRYEFRYLINGRDWRNDWHADEYVPNEFGSDNSVVVT